VGGMPMFHFLRRLPIRTQLLLLAASIGIIMFTIIFSVYFQVSKVVAEHNTEYTDNMMFQIKRTISNNCGMIDRLLSSMAYNRIVQSYTTEKDANKKYLMYKDVDNFFINLSSMNEGIIDFVILDNKGEKVYFLMGENTLTKEIIQNLKIGRDNYYTGVEEITYRGQLRRCIIIASDIFSILNGNIIGERIGTAAIVVDARVLSLEVNKDLKASATKFYLLDRNNRIYSMSQPLTSNKSTEFFKGYAEFIPGRYVTKVEGKRYVINKEDLPKLNGKIMSEVPEEKLFYDLAWARKLTITLFILALALLSIPFMVIVNNIVSPLSKFIKFFYSVRAGNLKELKQRLDVEGYKEMEIMVGELNSLLDEIDNLTLRLVTTRTRLYETELEKKKSELAYLKSQINPHFLYNTLEVMKGSAIDEGAVKTMGMAKALAQIFRYSVKGADIVSLREEVEIIKYYLQIQQVRFNDRFQINYEFSDEALKCNIPKMILQPIVENAVFHGLETKRGEGRLWFEGRIDEATDLCIKIKDDGIGMNNETVNRIQMKLMEKQDANRSTDDKNTSIGIINVNNRIKLTYGDRYGIKIMSALGQGTDVVIRIPARRDISV
jgi:two-component system sensor histidine kinase YesM